MLIVSSSLRVISPNVHHQYHQLGTSKRSIFDEGSDSRKVLQG